MFKYLIIVINISYLATLTTVYCHNTDSKLISKTISTVTNAFGLCLVCDNMNELYSI